MTKALSLAAIIVLGWVTNITAVPIPGRIRTFSAAIPTPTSDPSELDRIAQAVRMWGSGGDPRVPLMKRYVDSRRLDLTDDLVGRVLRFHGASPWKNASGEIEYRPVMLLAFRSIADDSLVAVHRTLLSDDGRKLDRRMLGSAGGAAIKIIPM
jgi:putative DNA primase/helicase